MKFLYIFALIALVKANGHKANFSGRIVNGQNASVGDEFVFRILSIEDNTSGTAYVSTGVAINVNFGLVTAQAVDRHNYWFIGHGSIFVHEHEIQVLEPSNFRIHPNYNPSNGHNDIAVVRFPTPVTRFIPRATVRPNFSVLLGFGYGYMDSDGIFLTNTLQYLVLMDWVPAVCSELFPQFDVSTSICGNIQGAGVMLDGDHGGPVTDTNRGVVFGLISTWRQAGFNAVVIVSIPDYADFIDASMAQLSEN